MTISPNEDDFPIAHWAFEGLPPTYALEAEESQTGKAPEVFYKLDTLSYAAEDGDGNLVAMLSDLPPKIEGMEMKWLDQEPQITKTDWVYDKPPGEDEVKMGEPQRKPVITEPDDPQEIKISHWESWDELKEGYAKTYAVFLEQQRREAEGRWEAEKNDLTYGIVLGPDDVYNMALLWDEHEKPVLEGPGVDYITTQPSSRHLSIAVASEVPDGRTPFSLDSTPVRIQL